MTDKSTERPTTIVTIETTPEGGRRLKALFDAGLLREINGIEILSVKPAPEDSEPAPKK